VLPQTYPDLVFPKLARFGLLALVLPLPTCVVAEPPSMQPTASLIQISLPGRYESWRPALQADVEALEDSTSELWQRWPLPTDFTRPDLQLVVVSSPVAAQLYAEGLELPGDAAVPRTHPSQRLALVPLPRDDRILAEMSSPPRTWRETVRHELIHLLLIDRPGLELAPKWFHEGLAEAMVSLQAKSWPRADQTALGSTWAHILRQKLATLKGEADLQQVLVGESAEIRYAAWAALVMHLLRSEAGPTPWMSAQANPTLAEFLQTLPEDYGRQVVWPRPRGREADFAAGGKEVILAGLPGQVVALQAGYWQGRQPLKFAMRVGRTGRAQAGVLLRGLKESLDGKQMRLRVNTFGAAVAALEASSVGSARAFQSRPKPGPLAAWRHFEISWQSSGPSPAHLSLQSEGYEVRFEASFQPPFLLEFYVLDGACQFRSEVSLLPPNSTAALR
jgi:hypothetical protein